MLNFIPTYSQFRKLTATISPIACYEKGKGLLITLLKIEKRATYIFGAAYLMTTLLHSRATTLKEERAQIVENSNTLSSFSLKYSLSKIFLFLWVIALLKSCMSSNLTSHVIDWIKETSSTIHPGVAYIR